MPFPIAGPSRHASTSPASSSPRKTRPKPPSWRTRARATLFVGLSLASLTHANSPWANPKDKYTRRALEVTDAEADLGTSLGQAFMLGRRDTLPPLDPSRKRAQLDSGSHSYETELLAGTSLPTEAQRVAAPEFNNLAVQTDKATYPASAWIDINNVTSVTLLADAAVDRMQTWLGSNGQYEWTPWWQYPVAGIAYADLDLATGTTKNREIITNLLNVNENGVAWIIDQYIDDQLWWGLFALKGYQLYGNNSWLQGAGEVQRNSSLYWDDTCGGGVLWLTYRPLVKNTITNALYMSLNARLYRVTGQTYYFDETMRTLNWWLDWAFDPQTGRVYDTIEAPGCQPSGLQIYTYNSGSMLSALVDIYYSTGNTTILDLARTIAYAGMRDYSSTDSGILRESCEHDKAAASNLPPGCGQDQIAFKGIFMAGLSYLYAARPTDINIYNYINTQLLSNTFNNVDESWLFGQWWAGPWNVTTAGPKTQISGLAMVAAGVTADVSFNALVEQIRNGNAPNVTNT